jgi:hypothetical protein
MMHVAMSLVLHVEECQTRLGSIVVGHHHTSIHLRGVTARVADPDPDWIRIQSGLWIRIRIRNPDPYPGGQK